MKFPFNLGNSKTNVGYFKIKVEIFVNKVGSSNINLGKSNIKDQIEVLQDFLPRCHSHASVSDYSCPLMKKKNEIGNDIYLVKYMYVELGQRWTTPKMTYKV